MSDSSRWVGDGTTFENAPGESARVVPFRTREGQEEEGEAAVSIRRSRSSSHGTLVEIETRNKDSRGSDTSLFLKPSVLQALSRSDSFRRIPLEQPTQ